jgi:hypothetical protein
MHIEVSPPPDKMACATLLKCFEDTIMSLTRGIGTTVNIVRDYADEYIDDFIETSRLVTIVTPPPNSVSSSSSRPTILFKHVEPYKYNAEMNQIQRPADIYAVITVANAFRGYEVVYRETDGIDTIECVTLIEEEAGLKMWLRVHELNDRTNRMVQDLKYAVPDMNLKVFVSSCEPEYSEKEELEIEEEIEQAMDEMYVLSQEEEIEAEYNMWMDERLEQERDREEEEAEEELQAHCQREVDREHFELVARLRNLRR